MEESIPEVLDRPRIGLGEERIDHRREAFSNHRSAMRESPMALGCAPSYVIGGIESGWLIDKDDRRSSPLFVGIEYTNSCSTRQWKGHRFGDELPQQDADAVDRPQGVDNAADVSGRTGDTLPLGEVVGSYVLRRSPVMQRSPAWIWARISSALQPACPSWSMSKSGFAGGPLPTPCWEPTNQCDSPGRATDATDSSGSY